MIKCDACGQKVGEVRAFPYVKVGVDGRLYGLYGCDNCVRHADLWVSKVRGVQQ